MSNPDNAAALQSTSTTDKDSPVVTDIVETPTFATQVNDVVSNMTQQPDGTWALPEGEHSEEIKFAASSEKRRRDTQSSYTKTQQENVRLTGERDAFKDKLAEAPKVTLTAEQTEELETLKHSDPDAWKRKVDGYQEQAKVKLNEEFQEVTATVGKQTESQRRKTVLDAYNSEYPDHAINDDVLENDIPPRITKKLESGKISFDEFLVEANTYLRTPKAINSAKIEVQPNLGNIAGSHTPAKGAIEGDIVKDYATTVIF